MLPGPDQVVACPRCGGLAKYRTLRSGNTFGARVWTDGKQIAPMLPRPPAVVRCRHCAEFHWLADAAEVGTTEGWGGDGRPVDPAWKDATYVEESTEEEYYATIAGTLARNRQEERSLRILAWWRRNDAFRGGSNSDSGAIAAPSDACRSNLEALEALLDVEHEGELVMKAEVLRERGEFEAAEGVLGLIVSEKYSKVVRQLRSLCGRGETYVCPLGLRD